jgi:hypothetical protein
MVFLNNIFGFIYLFSTCKDWDYKSWEKLPFQWPMWTITINTYNHVFVISSYSNEPFFSSTYSYKSTSLSINSIKSRVGGSQPTQ